MTLTLKRPDWLDWFSRSDEDDTTTEEAAETAVLTISEALEAVRQYRRTKKKDLPRYGYPVQLFIDLFGDIPIDEITFDMVQAWWDNIQDVPNKATGKPLSPYTLNSYARSFRAFLNWLVKLEYLDVSPAARLRLDKLPATSKNAMSDRDLENMLKFAALNPRNYAIILILRDSGCRVGELVTMVRSEGMTITERCYIIPASSPGRLAKPIVLKDGEDPPDGYEVRWRGRAFVKSDKVGKMRWIYFKHEATLALREYLEWSQEWAGDETAVWLNDRFDGPILPNGVTQALNHIGAKVGAKICNPHSLRHRFAKRMKEKRVDPEIIASMMGHADVQTYQLVYGRTTEKELQDYHTIFTD